MNTVGFTASLQRLEHQELPLIHLAAARLGPVRSAERNLADLTARSNWRFPHRSAGGARGRVQHRCRDGEGPGVARPQAGVAPRRRRDAAVLAREADRPSHAEGGPGRGAGVRDADWWRYMGLDRTEEFGARNGVLGELLFRLRPD